MSVSSASRRTLFFQFAGMFAAAVLAGFLASLLPAPENPADVYPDLAAAASPARLLGLRQIAAVSVFTLIICATLMFEERRLGVAFLGIASLLALKVITLTEFVHSTELHIILLLVGMMTLVGALKDIGFFTWIIQTIINAKKMTGFKFVAILMLLSGVMPGIVDEVTSIVFVLALVFQVCDTLKLRPTPFVLMSVMATNIGSTGTMLGNPVGILIGTKAEYHWNPTAAGTDPGVPLSFGDFIFHATPITFLSLVAVFLVLLVYYRKEIRLLDERLAERRASHIGLGPMVQIPYRTGLAILVGSLVFIASHHPLEHALGLEPNTMLVAAPLAIAGLLMVFRSHRARHYVENSIEWWSLLFFMMLFAVSFALEHCGVTDVIADRIAPDGATPSKYVLTPLIVAITAVGSAFVDNIVFVSTFIPIVKKIVADSPAMSPLWWALLFGACFGGNITAIGSTANLVAISMLGKRYSIKVAFFEWLKIGLVVGAVSCAVATAVVLCYYKTPAAG